MRGNSMKREIKRIIVSLLTTAVVAGTMVQGYNVARAAGSADVAQHWELQTDTVSL